MKYGETLSGVPADAGNEPAGTPGRPLYRKEIVFATATVVTAIALSSAAIEIGLRLMDYPPTPKIGWKWDRSPYKSLANLSDTRVNQLGLRGRSIIDGKDKFVVVLVGDSYLEAGAQPFEDMPEQILERELIERWGVLNARVSTVAAAGWSQDQQLLALESYFHRFRADLVLMWLTPFNDYWENAFVDRSVGPVAGPLKPAFRPRGLDAVEPVVLPTSSLKLFELIQTALRTRRLDKSLSMEQRYADWWTRTLPPSGASAVPSSECPNVTLPQAEIITGWRRGLDSVTAVTNEAVAEGRSHFAPFVVPLSARERYEVEITHRLVRQIQGLVSSNRAIFRIFYAANSDVDQALKNVHCVSEESTGRYFKLDFSSLTRHIENSTLAPLLMSVDVGSSGSTILSDTDWHLNRHGNELLMRGLARFLNDQKLLPH